MKRSRIIFHLVSFLLFFHPITCYVLFRTSKVFQLLRDIKAHEPKHQKFVTKLEEFESIETSLDLLIKTELEFFIAFKVALKKNLKILIDFLLTREPPSYFTDTETDFYLLLLIPSLVESEEGKPSTDLVAATSYLFQSDIRALRPNYSNRSINLGTFSILAVIAYITRLQTNLIGLESAYIHYFHHFRSFPHLAHADLSSSSLIKFSHLFTVFDVLFGVQEDFSVDEEGSKAFALLTQLSLESLRPAPASRATNSIIQFFTNCRKDLNCFELVQEWNLNCSVLVSCLHAIFNDNFNDVIFKMMIETIKSYNHSVTFQKFKLNSFLTSILSLRRSDMDTLQSDLDLIEKVLKFTMDVIKQPNVEIIHSPIMSVRIIIDCIVKEIDETVDWSNFLLSITEIFNYDGSLHYFIYWTLAHNSKLFPFITPEMISSLFTISPLFSSETFLVPGPSSNSIKIETFQERLFSLVDSPRSVLKSFLKFNPKDNLVFIQNFFDTFRAESDYQLISKLSDAQIEDRNVIIGIDRSSSSEFICATVNVNSDGDVSHKTKLFRSIIGIIPE